MEEVSTQTAMTAPMQPATLSKIKLHPIKMGKSWYLDREEKRVGVLGGESPANDTKNLEFITNNHLFANRIISPSFNFLPLSSSAPQQFPLP